MAWDYLDEDKKGGGNRNALAYGLLQGAGINTAGLSPGDAWELVSQLNLMESKRWKRTEEDKRDIKKKNDDLNQRGVTTESLERDARKHANKADFRGVSNLSAVAESIDTVNDISEKYSLRNLDMLRKRNLSRGTMASANGTLVNVGTRILRNPNAAYRICVRDFQDQTQQSIADIQQRLSTATDPKIQTSLQQRLQRAKEDAKYSRHNVVYQGDEIKSVVTHEMGHVIADQLHGFVNSPLSRGASGKNKILVDCFEESKRNGDIYKISAYAAQDADEFFAEAFTIYHMGREKLPPKIESMVKEMLRR